VKRARGLVYDECDARCMCCVGLEGKMWLEKGNVMIL
jgi:hypothetical protein